ncbi:MAG: hypothetical protein K6L76_05665 [Agarilytica sp.]
MELKDLHNLYSEIQGARELKLKSRLAKKFGQSVKWSGVGDEALFDRVESDLLTQNIEPTRTTKGKYREYYSWMLQSLAYSGIEKYKQTIVKFFDEKKYEQKITRHAEASLKVIDDFAKWNSEINRGLKGVSYDQLAKSRNINLINSGVPQLQRVGARLAIEKLKAGSGMDLMDLIEQRLLVLFTKTEGRRMELDAVSWMCRALGESSNKKYVATLERVEAESDDGPVRNWAGKSITKLTGLSRAGRKIRR